MTTAARVLAYLRDRPCVDCPESDPVVLDFDHIVPAEKRANLATMVRDGLGWDTIQVEIATCAVRCANCHRRRTARQFGLYRLEAAALAPVAQLDRAPAFEAGGLQVRSLSGAPHCDRERHGASWRSTYELINSQVVTFALVALCLVLALALWPPDVARAAPDAGCISGLPADLATQLQPLIQALGESTGQSPDCASITSDARGQDPPSQRQRDLELIAETLALLALADPGYGYAAPGYGYSSPGYGYPAAGSGTMPTPLTDVPATQPDAAPYGEIRWPCTLAGPTSPGT